MQRVALIRNKGNGGQDGFTLIEALIALLIFTIGILATISMQVSSLHGNSIARNNTEAAAIAASVVEGLRGLPFTHPDLEAKTHQPPDVGYHSVSYTVQDNALLGNTKTIRVTVSWTDIGTAREVVIDYVLADMI